MSSVRTRVASKRLVGITEGGIGVQDVVLLPDPMAERLRTHLIEQVFTAPWIFRQAVDVRDMGFAEAHSRIEVLHIRIAVHRQVGNVSQRLGGAVEFLLKSRKVRDAVR